MVGVRLAARDRRGHPNHEAPCAFHSEHSSFLGREKGHCRTPGWRHRKRPSPRARNRHYSRPRVSRTATGPRAESSSPRIPISPLAFFFVFLISPPQRRPRDRLFREEIGSPSSALWASLAGQRTDNEEPDDGIEIGYESQLEKKKGKGGARKGQPNNTASNSD